MSVNFIASSTDAITGIFHVMSITHTSNELSLNVHTISTFYHFHTCLYYFFTLVQIFSTFCFLYESTRCGIFENHDRGRIGWVLRLDNENAWKIFNGAITRDLKLRRCFGTNTPIPSTNEIESADSFQVTGYTCIDYRYYARIPIVKRLIGETLKRRTA